MNTIIFVGKFLNSTILNSINEYYIGSYSLSNHNFEQLIIDGIKANVNSKYYCVSLPDVYSYPTNSKKIYIKGEKYEIEHGTFISVPFLNLIGLNKLIMIISLFLTLLRVYNADHNKKHFIINTPSPYLLTAVQLIRLLYGSKIKITLIVPDIPIFISQYNNTSWLKRILVNWMNNYTMYISNRVDRLVLLTEQMKVFFKSSIPHIVMEGIVDKKNIHITEDAKNINKDKKSILYTGTLDSRYGILNLLEAYERCNFTNVELWLCGSGDSENIILNKAKINSNIVFYGQVDANFAKILQQSSTVLVNPRTCEGEYTKYSFPSKTMEYLLAAKPVVMNKLPGVPSEYYNYVITPKDEKPDSLAETLSDILSYPQSVLCDIGQKGKNFVLTSKNSQKQIERILKF